MNHKKDIKSHLKIASLHLTSFGRCKLAEGDAYPLRPRVAKSFSSGTRRGRQMDNFEMTSSYSETLN